MEEGETLEAVLADCDMWLVFFMTVQNQPHFKLQGSERVVCS